MCWLLEGRLAGLAWPATAGAPVRRDGLWEHTCLEAFFAPVDRHGYWELNVAPNGAWNLYRFEGPRTGMRPEDRVNGLAAFAAEVDGGARRAVTATLDVTPLAELADGPLAVGLTAVLETRTGERSYWALCHRGDAPDFHRRESFLARL